MSKTGRILGVIGFLLLAACQTRPSPEERAAAEQAALQAAPPQPVVVIDEFKQIADGKGETYRVRAGSYRLQLTATNDGASVTWVGATCQNAKETQSYDANCELAQDGQLQIGNPTTWGLGKETTVTIKLTKMPTKVAGM